jgi:predicted nucleotidyltransferase
MGVNQAIDITARQREIIIELLQTYLPGTTVWAFGSRVKFTSRPESDLDLVAFISPGQKDRLAELKEALDESDLPFRVDVLNWDGIPDNFKTNIEKKYVVLIEAGESPGR